MVRTFVAIKMTSNMKGPFTNGVAPLYNSIVTSLRTLNVMGTGTTNQTQSGEWREVGWRDRERETEGEGKYHLCDWVI